MGHTGAGDMYRRLGKSLDGLTTRAPWNEAFLGILTELYTAEEAELVVKMPTGLSSLDQLEKRTGIDRHRLEPLLNSACDKGLVIDLRLQDAFHYAPAPFVIGLFEFTMMRTGQGCDYRKWAGLFHEYMQADDSFYKANCNVGQQVALMRTLPHEEALSEYVEVLDYEKARKIIESQDTFAAGFCSCRHEKYHLGTKECDTPLDNCMSMGRSADYLVRHKMARKISRTEALEELARSKEAGLVFNADNVKANVSFICHCCGCCCNALAGVSKWGYANAVVSSTFIAQCDREQCQGCGKCARACPIHSIAMQEEKNAPAEKIPETAAVNHQYCLGCGVCALQCPTGAMKLEQREQRVFHPENLFEKVILASLERGTLQNQLFSDPNRFSHRLLRGLVGGFLRLPAVKRKLMSDQLRSKFLGSLEAGARLQGRDWLTKL